MVINSSSIGSAAEFAVAVSAMEYGFSVSQPLGCYAHYDLIMDVKGVLIKMQVKSLFNESKGPGRQLGLRCPCSRNIKQGTKRQEKIKYSLNDFDFAACYHRQSREIFIVPFDIFTVGKTFFSLSQKRQDLYRNAWHLLEEFVALKADRRQQSAFNPINERFDSF